MDQVVIIIWTAAVHVIRCLVGHLMTVQVTSDWHYVQQIVFNYQLNNDYTCVVIVGQVLRLEYNNNNNNN